MANNRHFGRVCDVDLCKLGIDSWAVRHHVQKLESSGNEGAARLIADLCEALAEARNPRKVVKPNFGPGIAS